MPLVSLSSLFLGFVLGAAVVAIVWNLTQRTIRNPEKTKLTSLWSLEDLAPEGARPAILASAIADVTVPTGSKVVVPAGHAGDVPATVLATCEVRMHPDVRVNAAVAKDKALVFSGPIMPRTLAVWTMDVGTVRRLQADFGRIWGESTPYHEAATVSELAGKEGRMVDVTGRASDVMEFRGRKMLRIHDGQTQVGVVARTGDLASFTGAVVRVTGRMVRENGYAYIDATKVDLLQAAKPVEAPVHA